MNIVNVKIEYALVFPAIVYPFTVKNEISKLVTKRISAFSVGGDSIVAIKEATMTRFGVNGLFSIKSLIVVFPYGPPNSLLANSSPISPEDTKHIARIKVSKILVSISHPGI
ncbi:MAG: hypothetical protein Q8M97_12845 [Methanobacteriaceae archaeon]|nr:hypothetical protein [Methanobacteriaceae archaeon]